MTECICSRGYECTCGLCNSTVSRDNQGRTEDVPAEPWLGTAMQIAAFIWACVFLLGSGVWFGGVWFVLGTIFGCSCVALMTCWALGEVTR